MVMLDLGFVYHGEVGDHGKVGHGGGVEHHDVEHHDEVGGGRSSCGALECRYRRVLSVQNRLRNRMVAEWRHRWRWRWWHHHHPPSQPPPPHPPRRSAR